MQCVQTLGSWNWSGTHSSLQPNVPLFRRFRARFWVFWGGKQTRLWSIGMEALPEWYKYLTYNLCNVCKPLEVTIQVALISFCSLTYLHLLVSHYYFEGSGVVNGVVRWVSVLRIFLNDTNIFLYQVWCVQTLGSHNWSGAHPFIKPKVPRLNRFTSIFWAFWDDNDKAVGQTKSTNPYANTRL